MGLDTVTYLRTEYVSAALFTNQTPRSADICLQLGCYDGRAVTFIPRTLRRFLTSSLQPDGMLPLSVSRQLKQSLERRGMQEVLKIETMEQRADALSEVEDETVDVVLSMQSAAKMEEEGLDWKKSIREAARVLKPGGRLLFVEQTEINGEKYLEYVQTVMGLPKGLNVKTPQEEEENMELLFEEVGYDDVDLVLQAHVAGVALKGAEAGMTKRERAKAEKRRQEEAYAELSISAFERGRKRKKKKKGKNGNDGDGGAE